MTPQQVAELSRLLDEALALDPAQREPWLEELERTQPVTASQLRSMLGQTHATDTELLPRLPSLESDDAVASAGERVGPYQLTREIGRGGMGSVWLAERADGAFKRRVALKLPRLTWAPGLAKRMAREREIGALLEHPNIARLYDAGVDEHGRPYIAMEYIEGQPIDVYCRDRDLDLRARLRLFGEVIQAVAYAHGRLVLHRDLKPSNVLVDANGRAHLLDFGIAKLLDDTGASGTELTREQGRVLTLNYASPEQIAGHPLGVTADVYALGVMLYELLTGTLPYRSSRNTSAAIEEAILTGDAPAASSRVTDRRLANELRGDVDAIIGKAIKREPSERYPTADALAADVQRYLDGRAIEARPDSTWYRVRKAIVRHRAPVMAVSAVLVVAFAGASATFIQGRRAAAEAQRTELATAFVSELFRVSAAYDDQKDPARMTPEARIERGAQLIEARFEKQPEMKADMYGSVAQVYVDLGVERLASDYASRQLQALQLQGADGERIAKSQMLLAEAALAGHRHMDAEEHARQALHSLPRDSALLPEGLALLARSQLSNGKTAEAKQTVAKARQLLAGRGAEKSVALSWLLYAEAELLSIEARFDETGALIAQAIDHALKVEGPLSRTAIDIRLYRARKLIYRSGKDEALRMRDAALSALQTLGGVLELRAALAKADLQMALTFTGHAPYPETVPILRDAKSVLDAYVSPVPAEVRAQIDIWYGWALMDSGDIAAGVPVLLRSAEILSGFTQDLRWQFVVAQGRGLAYSSVGDHDAADKALRQVLRIRDEQGLGKSAVVVAGDWVRVAQNLTRWGRPREAQAFLSAVPSFTPGTGTLADVHAVAYERAYAQLVAGDAAAALKLLPIDDPDPAPPGYPEFRAIRGEILCAVGNRADGLELMRSAMVEYLHRGMNNPELAYVRATAGLCALELGERRPAQEWAALARSYFEAQPGVSPYFKKPLAELEKRLNQPSRTIAISSKRSLPATQSVSR